MLSVFEVSKMKLNAIQLGAGLIIGVIIGIAILAFSGTFSISDDETTTTITSTTYITKSVTTTSISISSSISSSIITTTAITTIIQTSTLTETTSSTVSITQTTTATVTSIRIMNESENNQRHLDPLLMATQNCSECHTQVVEQALAGESNSYHNTHFNNDLLNFNCADCHKTVDIVSEIEDLNRVIDNATCAKCHSTIPVKTWMTYTDEPEVFAQQFSNCVGCHENWETKMDDATFVNLEVIENSDCRTCHIDNADKTPFAIERDPVTIQCRFCHD